MEIERQPSPWLPALSTALALADLPAATSLDPKALAPVAFGLEDLPATQTQRPLALELDTFGHLYVIRRDPLHGRSPGGPHPAAALAGRHSATADVHFYGARRGRRRPGRAARTAAHRRDRRTYRLRNAWTGC